MIVGIGNDVIDIRRIEETLTRFGPRFIDRIFTDVEIRKSERRAQRAASYAKRFAVYANQSNFWSCNIPVNSDFFFLSDNKSPVNIKEKPRYLVTRL